MNKKQLIKKIIKGQVITAIIYIIVYLIISFTIWDFYNPFYWMIHLNEAPSEVRFTLLLGLAFYYFMLYSIIDQHEKDKKPIFTNTDFLALQTVNELVIKYLSNPDFQKWCEIEEKIIIKYDSDAQKRANRKD